MFFFILRNIERCFFEFFKIEIKYIFFWNVYVVRVFIIWNNELCMFKKNFWSFYVEIMLLIGYLNFN